MFNQIHLFFTVNALAGELLTGLKSILYPIDSPIRLAADGDDIEAAGMISPLILDLQEIVRRMDDAKLLFLIDAFRRRTKLIIVA